MRTRGPDPLGARAQTEYEAQVSSLEDIVGSVRKYGEPPHSCSQTSKARCAPWPLPSRGGSVSGWVWSRCGGYLAGEVGTILLLSPLPLNLSLNQRKRQGNNWKRNNDLKQMKEITRTPTLCSLTSQR